MIDVKLVYDKLEVGDLYSQAVSYDCGAVSLFVGTTRDNFNDCKVKRLVYESYDQMAITLIENICKDIKTRWQSVKNVIIYHRLGEVPVGEASIVIAISSPHRQDSLEAVQFAINEIKSTIPIFKKEEYENGDSAWKENKECKWSSVP